MIKRKENETDFDVFKQIMDEIARNSENGAITEQELRDTYDFIESGLQNWGTGENENTI